MCVVPIVKSLVFSYSLGWLRVEVEGRQTDGSLTFWLSWRGTWNETKPTLVSLDGVSKWDIPGVERWRWYRSWDVGSTAVVLGQRASLSRPPPSSHITPPQTRRALCKHTSSFIFTLHECKYLNPFGKETLPTCRHRPSSASAPLSSWRISFI